MNYKILICLVLTCFFANFTDAAETNISLFGSKDGNYDVPIAQVTTLVQSVININLYRQVKIQVINNIHQKPDHILAYLYAKNTHALSVTRINITPAFQAIKITENYILTTNDLKQQPGFQSQNNYPVCPDITTQLLVISPETQHAELAGALAVADAGKSAGLKTVKLLRGMATRENILNYMSCPKLIGEYFDGSGNMQLISTIDGVITYQDLQNLFPKQFNFKVTTISAAAFGFNDPIKSVMINDVEAQQYIASKTALYIGTGDQTASCTMIGIIKNPSHDMSQVFSGCYIAFGSPEDQWGMDGQGSTHFGN